MATSEEKAEISLESLHKMLSEAYQPIEFRSNLKLIGAGVLGLLLWFLVGSIICKQFHENREYATKLAALKPEIEGGQISLVHLEKVRQIEKSVEIIDATSDRLYTFLAPILTAVTGYFFVAAGSRPRNGLSNPLSSTPPTSDRSTSPNTEENGP